jgi:hypothetical protein
MNWMRLPGLCPRATMLHAIECVGQRYESHPGIFESHLRQVFDASNKLPMLDYALLNYPSVWPPKWQDELDTAQPAAHIRSSPGTGFWGLSGP